MPTLQQLIRSYDLHFEHVRTTAQPVVHARTRFIHVRFGTDPNALSLLILGFVPDNPSATTGDLTRLPNGTYRASARIPVAEYDAYMDLLRNEQPLSLWFSYAAEPAVNQTVPLNQFSIFSGAEPPGEGPKDTSA